MKKRLMAVLALLVVALVATIFAACADTEQPQLTVKVNGKEVKANGTVYAVEVDSDVTQAVIEATTTVGEIKGSGTFNLKEGENEFVLTLEANDTETKYTVKVTRKAVEKPVDVTLAEVKVGEATLDLTEGKYATTVDYEVDKIEVTAKATDSAAKVEGTGEIALNVGKNVVTLTVTNGTKTQKYTVEITREAADLTLKEVKIGDEVLTAQDRTYTYNVANDVTQVTISATANNPDATVDGAGEKTLETGENTFTLTVSVGEGQATYTATYTIVVNRAKSSVKTIAKITVDGEDAAYNKEAKTYTATVGKFTAEVVIELTSSVSSYETDEPIGTLAEGENEFFITVTAEDGTTETYVLVLNVVLPTFNVSYGGNIDEAVTSEDFTYKYGEKLTITIVLDAPYTQSYQNLEVTYKVGDGEEKPAPLDDNYSFVVVSEEAIGNITVDVQGIEINTYTITYHRGDETTTETVEHGKDAQDAAFTPDPETGEVLDGYTYMHDEKWVTEEGGMIVANLTNITADADVYYKGETYVYRNVVTDADTPLKTINRFIAVGSDGIISFRVRVNDAWAGLNIVAAGGYVGVSGGVTPGPTWYIVTIDTHSGKITVTDDSGEKQLDSGTYTPKPTTLDDISIKLSDLNPDTDENLDVAAVNVDIVKVEFYDTDKTTWLHSAFEIKGGTISYVHSFAADSEGYVKTVDTWLPIDGAENKVYAAGGMYTKTYSVTGSTDGDVVNAGSYIMKYISVNNGKMEVFFTMNSNGMSLGVMEHSGWSQPLQTMNCVAGKMYKMVLNFDNDGTGTTASLFDENGDVFDGKENIDISKCTTSAFCFLVKTPVKTWDPLVYEPDASCVIGVRW